jgi:hypothetical protein
MAAGEPRLGNPRTDAERKKRHKKLYGNTKLPSRGTGLKKKTTKADELYNHFGIKG